VRLFDEVQARTRDLAAALEQQTATSRQSPSSTGWSRSPGTGGRDQSERLVAINRNSWSRSPGARMHDGPPPKWARWEVIQAMFNALALRFRVRLIEPRKHVLDEGRPPSPREFGAPPKFGFKERCKRRRRLSAVAISGGQARARTLSAARRKRIARHAAAVRWGMIRKVAPGP
jgi:hypothetical protein